MNIPEFYTDFSEGTPEEIANANMAEENDLNITKQFILKEITKTNGNYAVVIPNKDAVYMDKVDSQTKMETEKMVMGCISNASFIADNENRIEYNDIAIKTDITEATKDKFHTVVTVETTDNGKLFILY